MTIRQLLDALESFPLDATVVGTWEGTVREISIYQAKDGTVLIDADGEFYRNRFESGEWTGRGRE